MVIFCTNFAARSISFALMGFFHIKTSLSFVYLFELSPQKNKMFACSFVNLIDALPLIVGCVYFQYISVEVDTLLIIMSMLYLISLSIVALFFPESPKWLLITGQREKAIEAFNHIAKFNGSQFRFDQNARFIESDLINVNNITLNNITQDDNKSYAQVLKDVSM
mmetsp:Transcript_101614/g.140442  ORF Transcript_101614/g.140442 Transcript_101614/m.140442 type:complete len:165 (+) Transcript_101614:538-1032(+)